MEKSNKKSFLKGLFIGVGGTFLTALLAITIYGCASVNSKGVKAFGNSEVNFVTNASNGTVQVSNSSAFQIKYSTFGIDNNIDDYNGEVSKTFLYTGYGDYLSVVSNYDLDDHSISSLFSGYFTRTNNNNYALELFCDDLPAGVTLGSPCFIRCYQNGNYANDYNFVAGETANYSLYTTSSVGFECWITLTASSGVSFVYNQPLEDETSSASSETTSQGSSSTSEVIYWEEYSFPRDIYPQEVFPSVTWGNAGYGPDLTGTRNVYLDMQIRFQGEFWDSVLFRYIDASSGELTRYRWDSGEEAEMGTGALVNPHYYYCSSIQLYRTYSIGPSSYGSTSYELARVPSAVSNGGTPFQDTRLQWLVNDRTIEVYSADLSNRPSVWSGGFWDSSIDNRQYLNIIGATNSGGGSGEYADFSGVFDLITKAFDAVAVVFNIQVFPFATLGMFMLIPLVVGIVLFVVGLFKR